MPAAEAGSFADWIKGLFTGNAIQEEAPLEKADADWVTAEEVTEEELADELPVTGIEEEPVQEEVTRVLMPTTQTTDANSFVGRFKGLLGVEAEAFREAIGRQATVQEWLPVEQGEESVVRAEVMTAQGLVEQMGAGTSDEAFKRVIIGEETIDQTTPGLENGARKGFLEWLRGLFRRS